MSTGTRQHMPTEQDAGSLGHVLCGTCTEPVHVQGSQHQSVTCSLIPHY